MPKVVGVRLRYSKTLWFSPGDLNPKLHELVLVSTERGTELGMVYHEVHEVEESKLPAELKPVLRIADEQDVQKAVENTELEKEAFPVFVDYIASNKLDMNPIDVEYVFSGEMIVFYFSADERIDFRGLVKDLASHFKQRIDMRQIGVRDEARRVGGLGHCGQELCCSRLGGEFAPVAVKMAKDQGLPLNPAKISGLCGRLMCCLRYEVEAYKDFNSRAPKRNASISTPRGDARVVDHNALRELITLQFQKDEGGYENIPVALGLISCCKTRDKSQAACPCHISEEDFESIAPSTSSADDLLMPLIEPRFKNGDSTPDKRETDKPREEAPRARRSRRKSSSKQKKAASESGAEKGDKASQPAERAQREQSKRKRNRPARSAQAGPKPEGTPPATGERIPRRRRRD